jgi:hypothetical protein
MTWLGKILTILVFLGALVWIFLNVQSYALSTNWKNEYDRWRGAYKDAQAKREDDYRARTTAEDALIRQLNHERNRVASLTKSLETLTAEVNKGGANLAALQGEFDKGDVLAVKAQANITALNAQITGLQQRNTLLEDTQTKQAILVEEAKAEMVRAQNSEKLAQSIAADNAKKADDLQARLQDIRDRGSVAGGGGGRLFDKPPPPPLANLRGEVTDVQGDLVTISVGIDAGVGVGTVLELSRIDGGGRYLGTVKVTDAFNLYPKQAVVKFTPASGKPLAALRPEELPKKGDIVKPADK